ncbi:MAG: helix-turn-helix transcriptional regulator [Myxococcales bacterium]|nr:helix-turn-helix transcriptional regulator [Myxococcales bacterium]
MADQSKLFPALLKFWRGRRGLSQLDLALAAGISGRHVSFLETGRSAPSEEMVMLLAATLDVPLRDRNHLLRAAGFEAHFPEPPLDALADPAVERAVERMLRQQMPYPMFVMNRAYDVLRMNPAAAALLTVAAGAPLAPGFNGVRILFEPGPVRDAVADWDEVARELLARVQREHLHHPTDEGLRDLLDAILAAPGVPEHWRRPDFGRGDHAVYPIRFAAGGLSLRFFTTVLRFQAPQNVTLDELQIEGWYPLDEATEQACALLSSAAG